VTLEVEPEPLESSQIREATKVFTGFIVKILDKWVALS
jgi:hypothetical protein